jgi:hypothetical protein
MNYRSTRWKSGQRRVAVAHRSNTCSDFDAVRAGIGAELKGLHSELLRDPVTDLMAELLRQLDNAIENGRKTDEA